MHEHTLLNADTIVDIASRDALEIGINGISLIPMICSIKG